MKSVKHLQDEVLRHQVKAVLRSERKMQAEFLLLLGEMDARGLHLRDTDLKFPLIPK